MLYLPHLSHSQSTSPAIVPALIRAHIAVTTSAPNVMLNDTMSSITAGVLSTKEKDVSSEQKVYINMCIYRVSSKGKGGEIFPSNQMKP